MITKIKQKIIFLFQPFLFSNNNLYYYYLSLKNDIMARIFKNK